MKHLLTIITLSSFVVLAGCTSTQVPGDDTVAADTDNANNPIVEETNKNENTNDEVMASNENANTNTTEETEELDTSNWKTYENEEYGFSFKYPADYSVEIVSPGYELRINNNQGESIKFYKQYYSEAGVEDNLLLSKTSLSNLKEVTQLNGYSNNKGITINSYYAYSVPGGSFYRGADFFIEDDYVRFSVPLTSSFELTVNDTQQVDEFLNRLQSGDVSVLTEEEKFLIVVFDKIIGSITLDDDTSDWLTYENKDYGVSFMYPSEWVAERINYGSVELAEKNISVSVYYKYDYPKYESQYIGMANKVVSQESFEDFEEEIAAKENGYVQLSNGYETLMYVDGTEGSNLIKQYYVLHNDHLIILTADANSILKRLGLEREHFAEDNALSSDTPEEIVQYFAEFDKVVNTLDLSLMSYPQGNENFSDAASNQYAYTVFDDCGEVGVYENENWFVNFSNALNEHEDETKNIHEICYSKPEQLVIVAMGGGYCQPGSVARYNITDDKFELAERLNYNYGCVTTPTSFGARTGQIIEMFGSTGDAGCWAKSDFQYNFVTNQYRHTHSESACEQKEPQYIRDY